MNLSPKNTMRPVALPGRFAYTEGRMKKEDAMKQVPAKLFPERFLFNLILFGFVGQVAWNVENMYFNTFLYNVVYSGASSEAVNVSINVFDALSKMVAYSAVTAVLTTFLMGTLSDRLGSRRRFICVGYLFWGLTLALFGVITRENIAAVLHVQGDAEILTATVWTVIIMDCIMTFVGSTANDAGLNAWVTDATDTRNRASAESILAILPLAATGVVLGLGGLLVTGDDKADRYALFFLVLGAVVTVCGLVGLFTLRDAPETKKSEGNYFANLIYSLRPSIIRDNYKLYFTLLAVAIYSVAAQVFFPYLIIYLQHSPDRFFDLDHLALTPGLIVTAVLVVLAAVVGILCSGRLIDRYGKDRFVLPVLACLVAGLFILGRAHTLPILIIGAVPTLFGYALMGVMLNAAIRDFTPAHRAGLFQGVRMIFVVMLPMVIGPVIGKRAILSTGATFVNEYGVEQTVPASNMFLYAGLVAAFALLPIAAILLKGGFRPDAPR